MKKYYLHLNDKEEGPFTLEELKEKNLQKDHPIWHDELGDWTQASDVEELKFLFKRSTPPPFKGIKKPKSESERLSSRNIIIQISILIVFVIIITIINIYTPRENNEAIAEIKSEPVKETYKEKIKTIKETETENPGKFLIVNGDFKNTFLGNKVKISGEITNTATLVTYKDMLISIIYYDKNKTILKVEEQMINDVVSPKSKILFSFKADKVKNMDSVKFKLVKAVA